jgi:hypothetical protein
LNGNLVLTGNVGIGTTDITTYKLNINGDLNATKLCSPTAPAPPPQPSSLQRPLFTFCEKEEKSGAWRVPLVAGLGRAEGHGLPPSSRSRSAGLRQAGHGSGPVEFEKVPGKQGVQDEPPAGTQPTRQPLSPLG